MKKTEKIAICGHFALGKECFDGQTVKTRLLYAQLQKKYKNNNLVLIDTAGWGRHPFKLLRECVNAGKKSSNVIVVPAHRGVKVFIPLFVALRKKCLFKLHYVVVGGWLYEMAKNNRRLLKKLMVVDNIYFENKKTIDLFRRMGFNNLEYLPNFKDLVKSKSVKKNGGVFSCCIFSRIEKEKGVIDAIAVVNRYNKNHEKKINLDIYGKVKECFSSDFYNSISGNTHIKYNGIIDFDKSVSVIEKYDLLLFPTRYKTEGIPGTIIDAFFAGTPVLASKWDNFDEILKEGVTGFSYSFNDIDDFYKKLTIIVSHRQEIRKMRIACLQSSEKYEPNNAMRPLFCNLESKI